MFNYLLLTLKKKQSGPILTGLGWSRRSPEIRLRCREAEKRGRRLHLSDVSAGPGRTHTSASRGPPSWPPAGRPHPRVEGTRARHDAGVLGAAGRRSGPQPPPSDSPTPDGGTGGPVGSRRGKEGVEEGQGGHHGCVPDEPAAGGRGRSRGHGPLNPDLVRLGARGNPEESPRRFNRRTARSRARHGRRTDGDDLDRIGAGLRRSATKEA